MLPEILIGARDNLPGRGIARIELLNQSVINVSTGLDGWITISPDENLILSLASAVQVRVLASGKFGSPSFSFDALNLDYGSGGVDQVLNLGSSLVINNNGFFGPSVITTKLFDVQRVQIKHSAETLNGSNYLTLLAELIAIL